MSRHPLIAALCVGAMSRVCFAVSNDSGVKPAPVADPAAAALAALNGDVADAVKADPLADKTSDSAAVLKGTGEATDAPAKASIGEDGYYLRRAALELAIHAQAHKVGGPDSSRIISDAGEYATYLRGPDVA